MSLLRVREGEPTAIVLLPCFRTYSTVSIKAGWVIQKKPGICLFRPISTSQRTWTMIFIFLIFNSYTSATVFLSFCQGEGCSWIIYCAVYKVCWFVIKSQRWCGGSWVIYKWKASQIYFANFYLSTFTWDFKILYFVCVLNQKVWFISICRKLITRIVETIRAISEMHLLKYSSLCACILDVIGGPCQSAVLCMLWNKNGWQ